MHLILLGWIFFARTGSDKLAGRSGAPHQARGQETSRRANRRRHPFQRARSNPRSSHLAVLVALVAS